MKPPLMPWKLQVRLKELTTNMVPEVGPLAFVEGDNSHYPGTSRYNICTDCDETSEMKRRTLTWRGDGL